MTTQAVLNLVGWRAPVKTVHNNDSDWPIAEIIQTKPANVSGNIVAVGEYLDDNVFFEMGGGGVSLEKNSVLALCS